MPAELSLKLEKFCISVFENRALKVQTGHLIKHIYVVVVSIRKQRHVNLNTTLSITLKKD